MSFSSFCSDEKLLQASVLSENEKVQKCLHWRGTQPCSKSICNRKFPPGLATHELYLICYPFVTESDGASTIHARPQVPRSTKADSADASPWRKSTELIQHVWKLWSVDGVSQNWLSWHIMFDSDVMLFIFWTTNFHSRCLRLRQRLIINNYGIYGIYHILWQLSFKCQIFMFFSQWLAVLIGLPRERKYMPRETEEWKMFARVT